jgi:hypothetical protein
MRLTGSGQMGRPMYDTIEVDLGLCQHRRIRQLALTLSSRSLTLLDCVPLCSPTDPNR